jgi:predicted homoserine dehydrogenase-like protein
MLQKDMLIRESEKNPIKVGVSGAGWMGSGFVTQVSHVPGMIVNLLADHDIIKARTTYLDLGIQPVNIVETDDIDRAEDALRNGKFVVTPSYTLASQLPSVDIVADVTPSPSIGAETAHSCIENGKDIVLVNIEADVTVGRILKKLATERGVLYTVSSGDEPGCLMELWDFVTMLGYEPIVIGKGKNNPLDHSATPDTVAEAARKAEKDAYQTASYVDGTKTMFEMTCAANATGCLPMRRGMIGPEATLDTVSEIFALEEDGGITIYPGAVDFVQGSAMAGGVFVTVRILDDRIDADLKYLKVGKGKYYTFFRPYHLWFLEAPISIAKAFLDRETTLVPLDQPIADVMTIAKKDLQAGEMLDDFGGYTFYGLIDQADEVKITNALPVGLAVGAKIRSPIRQGQIITWDDVELDESSTLVRLRRLQDAL